MSNLKAVLVPSTTPTTTIYLAKSLRRIIYITAVGLGIAFVILPLVALLLAALSGIDSALLNSQTILTATMLSVITTLISTLLMLVLGIPLALWMSKSTKLWHKLIQSILTLPIVMPPAVAGLALLLTFGRQGLIGQYTSQMGINIPFTTTAVIMAQVFVAMPFFLRSAVAGFQGVGLEYGDAARIDGAAEWQVSRYVTIPMSLPSLSAGLVLAWARALGEFGATILFAGSLEGRTQTLPLLVYNIFERDLRAAAWVGIILIALALGALLISQWLASANVRD